MLVHARIDSSQVNGTGNRAVLWFQGCSLNCLGCWNEGTHPFDFAYHVEWGTIQTWLMNLPADVTGLTLSGGEPLQHSFDVLAIADFLSLVRPGFSIGLFTGYTLPELRAGRFQTIDQTGTRLILGEPELWAAIENRIDFAVMGRFNPGLVTIKKPLCGSDNQRVVLFSNRHKLADFDGQACEITIGEHEGQMCATMTGFPGSEFITSIKTAL